MNTYGYNLCIDTVKQGRHIVGSSYYQAGRSILTANPEMLVERYSGRGMPITINGNWINKERLEHSEIIGVWNSRDGKVSMSTNRGVFHYSRENGIHIVPARPADYVS